jgi:hypothetical protein
MAAEQGKKGIVERSASALEKIHYGIGIAALAGSVVFPEFAAPLAVIGAWEIVHGGLWTVVKKWRQNKSTKQPRIAGAPA